MKLPSKRRLILVCAAVVLALFLVRPGAARLKTRIATTIGMALQRQVEISKVHLRLLPQPGFDLDGFVVHDDPSFGAEPVLRAQEVTAVLRLSSLLRGRLEISRLSLNEPSLNLVRRDDGRWNIENFLERTAQITVAPTGKARSEPRPGFPYIEADRGRINFKFGPEKKPFAITDARYAFWQDSENTWGMRLRGQPLRTDFNLNDTGQLKVSGTWQRAESLRETPLVFNLQWSGAQLGQFTKLVSGEDRGWRGTLRTAVDLVGTPANLTVRGDGSLQDFRRYDIAQTAPLELKSHCEAHYAIAERSLHQILCQTPIGNGYLALTGEATNLLGPRAYELHVTADEVPLNAVVAVLKRAKKDLPYDLWATGTLQGHFNLSANAQKPTSTTYQGGGRTSDFHLQSDAAKADLAIDEVPFSLVATAPGTPAPKTGSRQNAAWLQEPDEPHLSIGPFPLRLGRPSPAAVQGWITRRGYSISLKGDSEVQRLLRVARMSGIPASHPAAIGSARVDLQITGLWSGFTAPLATGSVELHSVQAEVHGLNQPVEISSARINLTDAETAVDAISLTAAGTQWTGSLSLPRACATPQACPVNFELHADEISTDRLNHWLTPSPPQRPWYRLPSSTSESHPPFLTAVRASGTLTADRVLIRNLTATQVATKLDLDRGKLLFSDLRGEVMGGRHRGKWSADFTLRPPVYSGSGMFDGISLAQLSTAMNDNWIHGSATAKYRIELSGNSSAELADTAEGDIHFSMRDGAFPHVLIVTAPLRVRQFTGFLSVHQGEFELQQGTLVSPTVSYAVTGRASMSRRLDLKLIAEGSSGLMVTGTLADPKTSPVHRPETQAALKR